MSDLPLLESDLEDEEPVAPGRSPRTRRIMFLGALGVLIIVAAVIVSVGWQRLHDGPKSLSEPAAVGPLRHDTSSDSTEAAGYLRDALSANISLKSTLGSVYADPAAADRRVLLFGGTGKIDSPGPQLTRALALLNDDTGSVTDLHEVAAGPLGGVMKCGTSAGDGAPVSVCGWADNSSLIVALFPGRSVDESAVLLRQFRAAMEHQG